MKINTHISKDILGPEMEQSVSMDVRREEKWERIIFILPDTKLCLDRTYKSIIS